MRFYWEVRIWLDSCWLVELKVLNPMAGNICGKVFNSVAVEVQRWIKTKAVYGVSQNKKPAPGLFSEFFFKLAIGFSKTFFRFCSAINDSNWIFSSWWWRSWNTFDLPWLHNVNIYSLNCNYVKSFLFLSNGLIVVIVNHRCLNLACCCCPCFNL